MDLQSTCHHRPKYIPQEQLKKGNEERRCKLASESTKERDERENKRLGDRWAEQQDTKHPNIDSTFVGYKLEMLFEYPNTLEGGT